MTDLLVGWPLEAKKNSKRAKLKSSSASMYKVLSEAKKYEYDGHLITFAPTGAGKGVRVIIPNLLHYDGPVIAIDPKGENFAVTARYRKEVLGQRIFLLDPFEFVKEDTLAKVGVERAYLNPLDLIDAADSAGIETQLTMTASLLSTHESFGGEHDFWDNEAQKLMVGALGLTIEGAKANKKPPTFQTFMDYLYSDDVVYNLAVQLDTIGGRISPITYKSIASFLQKAEKERSGVLSTANSYLNPFLAKKVTNYLNSSSISSTDFSQTDNYTIYIVIPPSKLVSHSVLLRLWISTMLNNVMERDERPLKRTLFLLDECAQLGTLDGLRKAITLLRGYGLQVWMFFQDFSQISSLYPTDYPTLINNCGVLQSFGIHRNSGVESILRVVGEENFDADELTALDKTQQIVSIADKKPEILKLCNYLEDSVFTGRFDSNPLFNKSSTKSKKFYPFPTNQLKVNF